MAERSSTSWGSSYYNTWHEPPVPDAPGDLPLPRAGDRPCPRLRARRRLRPDCLRGHLDRRGGCGVRVLRGAAGDHPRRDLADGAGEDRPGRSPAIFLTGERFDAGLRCESDWSTRSPPTRTRRWPASSIRSSPAGRPPSARRNGSCSSRARRRTCWRGQPSGGRAPKARKGCGRFSTPAAASASTRRGIPTASRARRPPWRAGLWPPRRTACEHFRTRG